MAPDCDQKRWPLPLAVRLARYNVQHGTGKPGWFTGMPSPSAGMTLAVFYPFSQTHWYRQATAYMDFQREGLTILMVLLSLLMVSTVKYPRMPAVGFRSAKGLLGLALSLLIIIGIVISPSLILFPLGIAYLAFGMLRQALLRLLDRHEGGMAVVDGEVDPDFRRTAPRPGFRRGSEEKRE